MWIRRPTTVALCVSSTCIVLMYFRMVIIPHLQQIKNSPTSIKSDVVDCNPGTPCVYPEKVNFRIIILTYNRHRSLAKVLKSLTNLDGLENDTAIIEIWVDRDKHQNVNKQVMQVAESFVWTKGKVRINVQKQHVGIIGQWIHTWRPPVDGNEIAVIIEDDISLSPYIYRWLKTAHKAYNHRNDVAGYTLHCGKFIKGRGKDFYITSGLPSGSPFFYKLLGTSGYSPHPLTWRSFQDWFKQVRQDKTFHPYVSGLRMTQWYKGFERRHYEHSMWEQWHIYFSDKFNLHSLYSNMETIVKDKTSGQCLIVNRQEIGLHQHKTINVRENTSSLISTWKDEYAKFPDTPLLFDWDGTPSNN